MFVHAPRKGLVSLRLTRQKMGGRKDNLKPMWDNMMKRVDVTDEATKWNEACGKHSARVISNFHFPTWLHTVLSCGKLSNRSKLGFLTGSRFRRCSERLKINVRWHVVYFRKPHLCSNKLNLQEANSCVTQKHPKQKLSHWTLVQDCKGIPALNLWDMVIDVLEHLARRNPLHNTQPKTTKSPMEDKRLPDSIDYVLPNAHSSSQRASLFVFEANGVVVKMIMKGRSPTMGHISWTHHVNLDSLFDRIILFTGIQIK